MINPSLNVDIKKEKSEEIEKRKTKLIERTDALLSNIEFHVCNLIGIAFAYADELETNKNDKELIEQMGKMYREFKDNFQYNESKLPDKMVVLLKNIDATFIELLSNVETIVVNACNRLEKLKELLIKQLKASRKKLHKGRSII